jgi:hypothetical protein
MNKVAPETIGAVTILEVRTTLFSFVSVVRVMVVLSEFILTVSELALVIVRTVTVLQIVFA